MALRCSCHHVPWLSSAGLTLFSITVIVFESRLLNVCEQCFAEDWQKMMTFARHYDPSKTDRNIRLGKRFREIIGTRNRTKLWNSVAASESRVVRDEIIVDGVSLQGLQCAIQSCMEGLTTISQLEGRVIGRLVPEHKKTKV